MDFNSQFYGLSKTNKNARHNGFIFNQINNLTKKISSSPSNINIQFYLKFRIPILHLKFFRINSQNKEYVKTHCENFFSSFHFACRKGYLDNQSH